MHEQSEKVEFFHSESSFGSESNVSESRYADFNNELLSETENVFNSLRKELHPNQTLNDVGRVQYVIRRARILHRDSLPEQINYLSKIEAPPNTQQSIVNAHRKVGKLLSDYEQTGKGGMAYKDFYNVYGKEFGLKDSSFSRKKQHLEIGYEKDAVIQPERIEISYSGERQKLRGSTPRLFMGSSSNNSKENAALKEEIYQLKKNLEESHKKHELERTTEKLAFEKRLQIYLANASSGEIDQKIKIELTQQSEQINNLLNANKKMQEVVEEKEKIIESLKAENSSLKEQIIVLRKTDNNMDYPESHNKSFQSEDNELTPDKRNEKRIKNLTQENQLLKNQLQNQRQRWYRQQSDLTQEQRRQLERNRKIVENKTKQLEELYLKYDEQKIQLLHLTHNTQSASKTIDSLKKQNQFYKTKLQKLQKSQKVGNNGHPAPALSIQLQKPLEISRKTANKIQIYDYDGQGIQGYPYYQSLSKEFRVRFKRSCFRDKQLLYKANGIEVGVITTFQAPNKISILIHLTNYTQGAFRKLKGKIINANQNRISGEQFEQETLASNEQIKVPVSLTITQYPIGPLILLLQCDNNEKKQELRILLPAHIFKTMKVQQRADNLANPTTLKLYPQRKICKQLNDLRSYFKLPKKEGPIRIDLYNEHTYTLISVDISQAKEYLELSYEHRQGNRKITEYFIKTLEFLLSK